MGFFEENWLWRGTQSAIFYYVSCSPCVERKYKRKRRNEAERAQKQREEVIAVQPGRILQPGAFQTNEEWAEEILIGPGPPKGWKRDPVVDKLSSACDKATTGGAPSSLDGAGEHVDSSHEHDAVDFARPPPHATAEASASWTVHASRDSDAIQRKRRSNSDHHVSRRTRSTESVISTSTSTSTSSSDSDQPETRPRPSLERRLSTAMDNLRDTLRSSMRPENWNWIRYERDDEILSGFNQRVSEMWNRATSFGITDKHGSDEDDTDLPSPRKKRRRASTIDSDRFDFQKYSRNPEINELHPPVVSRLPTTRDDAAWMILPPPSAAIMEGKTRPKDEPALRWPLAHIGRTPEEWKLLTQSQRQHRHRSETARPDSIPELSGSCTEPSPSDEDVPIPIPIPILETQPKRRHPVPLIKPGKPVGLNLNLNLNLNLMDIKGKGARDHPPLVSSSDPVPAGLSD